MRVWMKRIFLLTVMGCYLAFAYLLYNRWLVTEAAHQAPVRFQALLGGTNVTTCGSFAAAAGAQYTAKTARTCVVLHRLDWATVMAPLWLADVLTLCAHSALLTLQAWRPAATSFNARLEHASGACRAVLYALFKVLLLDRLVRPASPAALSWFLIFAPIYVAAVLQAILHSFKTLEGGEALFRGRESSRPRRRPGFALTLDDTLSFNVSLQLAGVFYVRHATWSVVLWPLWLVAAICGVGLFLLICFGVPMLSRRYPTRQFLMVLPPLLLLLATYSLSMHALIRAVEWLDSPGAAVHAADIMSPAIAAAWCLWLLLAVVTLSAVWHVPVPQSSDADEPREPPSYESLSAQLPALLVRESSTLFRQVSARTLRAYNQRYGQLMDEEDEEGLRKGGGDSDGVELEDGRATPRSPLVTADGAPGRQGSSPASTAARAGGASPGGRDGGSPGGSAFGDGGRSPRGSSCSGRTSPLPGGTPYISSDMYNSDQPPTRQVGKGDGGEPLSCWICLRDDVLAEAVLLHCGHGGLCLSCAANLWRRRSNCPMCRAPIALVARVGDCVSVDDKYVVSPELPPPPEPPDSDSGS